MKNRLFPLDLPSLEWVEFSAAGFERPVTGVIYRANCPPCCGVPLGGIGTGCLDIEAAGVLGFNTVFNAHPRRPQLLLPFLGLVVEGKTFLLTTQEIINGGTVQGCTEPTAKKKEDWAVALPKIEGVSSVKKIHYWGHYPVADLEYELEAPFSVGLRAWSPFIPGDIGASSIPGAVFEVHLRNTTDEKRQGTIAFSFPGPTPAEVEANQFQRQVLASRPIGEIKEPFNGVLVSTKDGVSYVLGVIGEEKLRVGGSLGANGAAWANMATTLPEPQPNDSGASVAVDFELEAGEVRAVRFVLAWYAPGWQGEENIRYNHMYTIRYNTAEEVARRLAEDHDSLLKRVLAWQSAIYASHELPGWLRDTLVNNLCLITEDSFWAQPKPPLGDWCYPDGLFVLNESPRGCPQIECIPCSWYGNLPIVYFFPQLARTTLRGYKHHMRSDGAAPFDFAPIGTMGLVSPRWDWQISLNGVCFVDMVDRLWRRSGNDDVLEEFYDAVKRSTQCTINLRPGPEGVISMPDGNVGREWWESEDWYGMCTHVGGMHLSNLKIAQRMAEKIGDNDFARQCQDWFEQGSKAMEEKMWHETSQSYLLYNEPDTGKISTTIMTNQLDGQWANRFHGLEGVFRADRVKKVLATVKRTCLVENGGAVSFADADGTPQLVSYGIFPPETYILGMTFMYEGDKETGLEIVRRSMYNTVIRHRHPWDLTNMIRCDTGERTFGTDYYQNMMLWAAPAAVEGKDISALCAKGGLVDRVIQASREKCRTP
ncbi:hypothetical protein FJZ31_38810 [Candidatus Poribacteria bacterium]|nr:hypothetical protein [Candidatus Poribacteria bacterium]